MRIPTKGQNKRIAKAQKTAAKRKYFHDKKWKHTFKKKKRKPLTRKEPNPAKIILRKGNLANLEVKGE